MSKNKQIELLSPAKNANGAIEAIQNGADAVYMGGPKFGARVSAGNNLDDIKGVIAVAHFFHVRVYVTINTLLFDEELTEVERLIVDLWRIGVDALIIQDPGITRLTIPPIPFHASTQMNNRTVEKVRFLEQAGFTQVVLARELSLDQIKTIAKETSVVLEAFIHGSLCVAYSGTCYMSQVLSQRSGNRGACAQWCRLPYDLEDALGQKLISQQHLLSLKDLNATDQLESLIDAGISSFKIEGRLKEVDYVKNTTAWYNNQLNQIIRRRKDIKRTSIGFSQAAFVPDVYKSFNRGFTAYFLQNRTKMANFLTPKSMGEPIAVVKKVLADRLLVESNSPFSNGDGVGFVEQSGTFNGFRINRVDGNWLYPARMPVVKTGDRLYRTHNQGFIRLLNESVVKRVIPVRFSCWETPPGFACMLENEYGHRVMLHVVKEKISAKRMQQDLVKQELSKMGNTRYELAECSIKWTNEWFIPVSEWAAIRRQLCEKLDSVITMAYKREIVRFPKTNHPYPDRQLSKFDGVLNQQTVNFYQEHGVESFEWAPEHDNADPDFKSLDLMKTKYCLLFELGLCLKTSDAKRKNPLPYYLVQKDKRFELSFDCTHCEMSVRLSND